MNTYFDFDFLFDVLEETQGVSQREDYHPEGDVFTHSLQALNNAFRESKDIDLILAAMLHDVGKSIEGNGHEDHALTILQGFISHKTAWLIAHHMRIRYFLDGLMKKRSKIFELYENPWFKDLIILNRWDNMSRSPDCGFKYNRERLIERLYALVS